MADNRYLTTGGRVAYATTVGGITTVMAPLAEHPEDRDDDARENGDLRRAAQARLRLLEDRAAMVRPRGLYPPPEDFDRDTAAAKLRQLEDMVAALRERGDRDR